MHFHSLKDLLNVHDLGLLSLQKETVALFKARDSIDQNLVGLVRLLSDIDSKVPDLVTQVLLLSLDRDVWAETDDVLFELVLSLKVNKPDVVLDQLHLLGESCLFLD